MPSHRNPSLCEMKFYNTLSKHKEDFSPTGSTIRMYVCGVTPYAPSHIGHAMSSVVFDVVRRYLAFKGYEVKHVQNFTDIDDKMIQAAAKAGISPSELAETNIQSYLHEMNVLNVLPATLYPRATKEIPKIIDMIEVLVAKKFAYSVNGDVYFRVRRDPDYGKLSHRSLENMKAGARVEINEQKEDVMDFALWKSKKPGEPAWDSPWGPGRPGWHLECSAMSVAHLGQPIDIHGGGADLIFPHHENEIAQAECSTDGALFARFWLHNGLLRLGESKMSKSVGNIVSVAQALEKFSPDALRLFFLSSHYRSPLVYSEEQVTSQERSAERLHNALRPSGIHNHSPVDPSIYRDRFVEAMDDDLNTPRALAALFDLTREINRGHEEDREVTNSQQMLKQLAGVLGLTLQGHKPSHNAEIVPFVRLLVEMRANLRADKLYTLADQIRLGLANLGVELEDTAQGTEWKRKLP